MNPLVLVQNEITVGGRYDHWQDVTGERYQYPNRYRNLVIPGRPFLYYRGTRRADGSRGTPEYFGCGVIGGVYVDPDTANLPPAKKKWICDIEEYNPFAVPVPFKIGGQHLEEIAHQNLWQTAVREIPVAVFDEIVSRGGLAGLAVTAPTAEPDIPLPENTHPQSVESSLLIARTPPARGAERTGGSGGAMRRSRYSTKLGRQGEAVVLRFLEKTLPPAEAETLRWVASTGETPGWDIEYVSHGQLIAVEVKATGGSQFVNVELTSNEWAAAESKRARYRLALVAHVKSDTPLIEFIDDPMGLLLSGVINLEPSAWRLSRSS